MLAVSSIDLLCLMLSCLVLYIVTLEFSTSNGVPSS